MGRADWASDLGGADTKRIARVCFTTRKGKPRLEISTQRGLSWGKMIFYILGRELLDENTAQTKNTSLFVIIFFRPDVARTAWTLEGRLNLGGRVFFCIFFDFTVFFCRSCGYEPGMLETSKDMACHTKKWFK